MPNYLKMPKKLQVLALLELEWSYRRIEAETGVRRETGSRSASTSPCFACLSSSSRSLSSSSCALRNSFRAESLAS